MNSSIEGFSDTGWAPVASRQASRRRPRLGSLIGCRTTSAAKLPDELIDELLAGARARRRSSGRAGCCRS